MSDTNKRAAEVLREYAAMIEESEINRSGPLEGRCAPAIEEEVAEYRALADALVAPSESGANHSSGTLDKPAQIGNTVKALDGWADIEQDYKARKPRAWQRAREILQGFNEEPPQ